jgi:hypothetical protein
MSHHPTAKDVFIAKKAAIDAMLARLQALSDANFGSDPDALHWAMSATSNITPSS